MSGPDRRFAMLFSSTYTFAWDLVIALLLGGSASVCMVCAVHLRRTIGIIRWAGVSMVALAGAACFAIVAYGSFVEPQLLSVTTIRLEMPVKESLRIAVLSDLHIGPYKDAAFVRRAVDRVNELVPDIVLLTGDYLMGETDTGMAADGLEPLKHLRPAFGSYAVLGNHDHGLYRTLFGLNRPSDDPGETVAEILEGLGVRVLQNENVVIDLGTGRLAIAGIEDRWMPNSSVDAAMEGIEPGTPIVLAAHNPDVLLEPRSASASLIVAGHTHGGQIRLPGFGPVPRLPTRLGRVFDQGAFTVGESTTLAITRGLGESGPRVRLFAPPEILVLQIEPKTAD